MFIILRLLQDGKMRTDKFNLMRKIILLTSLLKLTFCRYFTLIRYREGQNMCFLSRSFKRRQICLLLLFLNDISCFIFFYFLSKYFNEVLFLARAKPSIVWATPACIASSCCMFWQKSPVASHNCNQNPPTFNKTSNCTKDEKTT